MKRLFLVLVFLSLLVPLFAIEGGGSLSANVDVRIPIKDSTAPISINNYESLSFWLRQNMDKAGYYNFNVAASYYFNLTANMFPKDKSSNTLKYRNIINPDYLNFSFLFPLESGQSVDLKIGRYSTADYTQLVYRQQTDGIGLKYTHPYIHFQYDLGYTGLLNNHANPMSIKPAKENDWYTLTPALITNDVRLRGFVGYYGHSIGTEFLAAVQPKLKDPVYQMYATLFVNGPIVPRLFFDVAGVVNMYKFSSSEKMALAGLANAKIAYYFNDYSASLGFQGIYASGGDNSFIGLSQVPLTVVTPVLPVDTASLGLFALVKPIEDLSIKLDATALLTGSKPVTGTSPFVGFEYNARIDYNILENLYLKFSLGHFIDSVGGGQFLCGLKFTLTY